jgi:geranylgeranyl diphosphate synthase type II
MGSSKGNILNFSQEMHERIDLRLEQLIGVADANSNLTPAVRYALLAPGKRLRPLLCLMSAHCLGGKPEHAIDPACAIEMVHTASLIVDDLPCMDNAEMRRGKASCHEEFGNANTILVAFELLSIGYQVISQAPGLSNSSRLQLVQVLARATGISGLIGGQVRDLEAERERNIDTVDTSRVMRIHELKTGALFIAAAESGGIVAGLQGDQLIPIRDFAAQIGLAYQTLDDLLDVQGTTKSTGKDVGKDAEKSTLVGALGPEAAREYADNMIEGAVAALHSLGPNMRPLEKFVQNTLGKTESIGRTFN